MSPKRIHYFKLLSLAATLWALYLLLRSRILGLEPLEPTLLSVAFALAAHRLRVDSWPVIIAFPVAFFVEGVAEAYLNSAWMHDPTESIRGERTMVLTLWAIVFSPISLWGPLLLSVLAYGYVRRRPAPNSAQ